MNNRDLSIDLVKVIAMCMVLLLHTGVTSTSYLMMSEMRSVVYAFSGIAVPLFFMVSGYLMAERRIDMSYVKNKTYRILRFIFITTTVVLMIYDGTYWRICSYKDNSTYSEISVANITNLTGSSAGLVTGRRFKSAFDTNTENGAAATTNYDKANLKNIIESDSAPGTTTAPNGTVWLQYGNTWVDEAADYIVEYGTSGIWTYRKWNSGIAECWGKTAATTYTFSSTSGYAYYVGTGFNLPSGLFNTVTCGFAERAQGTGSNPSNTLITVNVNNLTTTTLGVFVQSTIQGSQSITISCRVEGTWK